MKPETNDLQKALMAIARKEEPLDWADRIRLGEAIGALSSSARDKEGVRDERELFEAFWTSNLLSFGPIGGREFTIAWVTWQNRAALAGQAKSAAPVEPAYRVFMDGDQWCAVGPTFVDLQQSPAGFADTPYLALERLTEAEGEEKRRAPRAADWKARPEIDPYAQGFQDAMKMAQQTAFPVHLSEVPRPLTSEEREAVHGSIRDSAELVAPGKLVPEAPAHLVAVAPRDPDQNTAWWSGYRQGFDDSTKEAPAQAEALAQMLARYIEHYDAKPSIECVRLSRDEAQSILDALATPSHQDTNQHPSEDQVERACKVQHVGWSLWHEPQKKTARQVMRQALIAARLPGDDDTKESGRG
ncbi:hypothetical protein H4CHR_01540 [Variovorax sp. PBS-H4]|uniref:hypothetical protein n=1 Tax=Variovorax sp. PBS-H4 TaxID=434008 RepID=UPI001317FF49|nr:hypothetical protein [Variovorax sp. PBS-H4]VTU25166.1 hypothetical protein H4CHR_01540 [Variovorax sp. PBS-H4]